ncbi:HEAT repeat domain-containing protein [Synechococcus sp. CS-1329]|uniref:HEAT repeat domain-containing protein n=1 Tax=Synechococcus sp. CS-1329 TaxID=2847975 RepID=UPI00223B555D|nr:HEAT repeat domain-containing protein [Synechococcus sp. CS-1329]MCT0219330.1 HEAT repeat domain-containing protein [Synechococcus sp. CS-1329]
MPSPTPAATEPTELIEALREADSSMGLLLATRRLAEACHPGAATSLVEVLGFNNPGAAVAAVDGLIALGEQAVEPLLANLDGHNYGARAWAVRALAGIGDVRGLELLESALACDIGPSVRRAAARGLGQLQLSALSQSEQARVRQRCLEALLAGAGDGEWVVRYAVATGLEQLLLGMEKTDGAQTEGLGALQAFAGDPGDDTPVVRLRAELALERLADQARN